MPKKVKQNYILLEDIPSTRTYKHISPVAFTIIALTFFFSIPSSIFWTLIIIYILYCFVPLNPDVSQNDEEFHPSFSVENSNDAPLGLAALLGDSDGLRKLQTFVKFFLPKDKSKPDLPEIQTVTRRTSFRQSMSIEGQTLLNRINWRKQKWLSFINGSRPSADNESTYRHTLSSQLSISSNELDINANYINYDDDIDGSGGLSLEDADVIVVHDNESISEDSLVLHEHQSLVQDAAAPTLMRSVSTKTKSKVNKKQHQQPQQQQYKNIVNVVLIRGKHLDFDRDYYVKFQLGKAKCKSKVSFVVLLFVVKEN